VSAHTAERTPDARSGEAAIESIDLPLVPPFKSVTSMPAVSHTLKIAVGVYVVARSVRRYAGPRQSSRSYTSPPRSKSAQALCPAGAPLHDRAD
jgi:hypothetical protein